MIRGRGFIGVIADAGREMLRRQLAEGRRARLGDGPGFRLEAAEHVRCHIPRRRALDHRVQGFAARRKGEARGILTRGGL